MNHPEEELTRDSARESIDELIASTRAYQSGPELKELFDFVQKFPHLAPFNAMLVHIQNSGVQYVLRASDWRKKYWRRLKPKARPYVILWPMAPVHFVFDLSDTEPINPDFDQIPALVENPFPAKGTVSAKVMKRLHQNAPRRRIVIEYIDGATGLAGQVQRVKSPVVDFVIFLNQKHSETQQFGTLVHELAHIFCGHLGTTEEGLWPERGNLNLEGREFEAEAVAYLVSERMRLEIGSHSYLSGYLSKDGPLPEFSLEAILKATHMVEEMATGLVRVRKKPATSRKAGQDSEK